MHLSRGTEEGFMGEVASDMGQEGQVRIGQAEKIGGGSQAKGTVYTN